MKLATPGAHRRDGTPLVAAVGPLARLLQLTSVQAARGIGISGRKRQ